MDINSAPRAELVRLIYEMADKIQLLEGEIARLKEKLHEKGKVDTSSQPPSFVKANAKKKKVKKRKQRPKIFLLFMMGPVTICPKRIFKKELMLEKRR